MSIFTKFFGDPQEKKLAEIKEAVSRINYWEPQYQSLAKEDFPKKTQEFKERLSRQETLDDLLPEVFALAREAAKRTLGQRHFNVQLMGGVVLHKGQIAEMKTGEGKTLAATLPIYLNALAGKGVHVITVNDYLSRRDANWMGPVYRLLGLSCACLNHEKAYFYQPEVGPDKNELTIEMENLKEIPRREAYQADITYGTNNEFGFDYLRDNMAPSFEQMVQRRTANSEEKGHFYAIIDEVDSVLIDEARTPLIISMPDTESTKLYQQFSRLVPSLRENRDYNIDEKARSVVLTEEGISRVEKMLGFDNIYEAGGVRYVHHLEQALRAQVLFKKDRDYVIKDGQVIIVDEFTGRLMPGRRYSEGLHQALEAKEGVYVQQESRTLASITFQNYFRMYDKLAGMTGTAMTSAEEFHKVYQLEVAAIPTNEPLIRKDLSDSVYKTEKGKWQAIAKEIKGRHKKGQPILVGTVSIEKNELLSSYLKREGVAHQLLNAKNHEHEAQIIAQAGKKGAVTVATNMAGRGVDIVLGGRLEDGEISPELLAKQHEEVTALGGLYVIGTERHEARRIDDQLRGRSGRQGDPGRTRFFVSLEDDLMRVFGGERVKAMMNTLKIPEDQPIENRFISKAIESAQAKIEGYNFDIRKHVLEYDDVLNKQRETIYKKRREVLSKKSLRPEILSMAEDEIKKIVHFHSQGEQINYQEIAEIIKSIIPFKEFFQQNSEQADGLEKCLKEISTPEKISAYLIKLAQEAYQKKEALLEGKNKEISEKQKRPKMRQIERFVFLRTIDALWMDHIDGMDHLRDSVRLRAYGQKDPLTEYKNEGMRLFQRLLSSIQTTVINTIYKVDIKAEPAPPASASLHSAGQSFKGVSRNDPCPCGSGKKYKKCHGG